MDYASIKSLSSQSRKFLKLYKKLFNEISAKNQNNNSLSLVLEGAGIKKMPSAEAPYTRAKTDGTGAKKDIDEVQRYVIKYPSFKCEIYPSTKATCRQILNTG